MPSSGWYRRRAPFGNGRNASLEVRRASSKVMFATLLRGVAEGAGAWMRVAPSGLEGTCFRLMQRPDAGARTIDLPTEPNLTVQRAKAMAVTTRPPSGMTRFQSLLLRRHAPRRGRRGVAAVALAGLHSLTTPPRGTEIARVGRPTAISRGRLLRGCSREGVSLLSAVSG